MLIEYFSSVELKYELTNEGGEGHNRSYTMSVVVDEQTFEGTGRSKKMAKAEAAKYALIKVFNILTVPGELFPLYHHIFIIYIQLLLIAFTLSFMHARMKYFC